MLGLSPEGTESSDELSPGQRDHGTGTALPCVGLTTPLPSSAPFPTESTSVFVGQCFVDRSGKEVLKTKWLQRLAVDDISDDWIATR